MAISIEPGNNYLEISKITMPITVEALSINNLIYFLDEPQNHMLWDTLQPK